MLLIKFKEKNISWRHADKSFLTPSMTLSHRIVMERQYSHVPLISQAKRITDWPEGRVIRQI